MIFYSQKIKYLLIVLIFSSTLSCDENQSVENTNTQNPVKHKKEDSEKTVEAISNSLKIKNPKYSFEHLDNTTGLSSSSINSIFQDSEKLLWIGTWDGLNRYDGNKFKIFRPEINNKNSLSNQVVLKIGEDNDGQIWVLTMHGINKYDKRADTFKRYYFSKVNSPPLSESEFNMAFDPLNNVFCAVKDWGVGYYNQDAFKRLDAPNLPEGSVRKMAFTKSGDLILLFENNELHLLNIKTNDNGGKIISKSDLITDDVHEFEIIQNQKISIISISGELRILSIQHQESFDVIQRGIRGVIGTIPEGLMVSNKSGLLIIDSLGNTINQPWKKLLKNQKVTTIMYGSENVLWAGTDGNGVFKLYPQEKSFNLISRAQVPELDKSIVRAFTKIEGNSFWVGTKGKGLFRFQSNFHQNTRESITFTNFNESNSPINNSVYALHSGRDGLIFIGTDGDGLCVYDLKKSKFIQWSDIIGSEQCDYFKSIYAIYQDKKGTIWIGTNGFGMIRFKIERFGGGLRVKAFKKYLANNTKSGVLSSNIIFSIIPKNDNELWIGTRLGGLNLLNKNTGLFKTFKNDVNDLQSISSNDILCLHTDLENKLWVGTSFGLNVLNEMKDNGEAVFKKFTVKDGLPNNTIHGIVSDNQNNLWISTNFGLSNFKLDESKFINFTKNEGLQNNEFADGAFYHDAESDYVIMGGIEGFNYFLPSKIMESTFIPNIFINEISGQNKETTYYQSLVIPPDSNTFPSIVLNHDDNYFDIDLAALTYINNEKCKYAYQLGGFNDHWINIDNRKIISFTNVPPGKYSLWLKWTNSDGAWSNPVQAIDIEIQPIFWRSKTAVISYYLLFVFFILFIWSYFNKQYKLKQNILSREIEEEIHQNRLTFFTNIAHEFQTPLTLITGPIKKLSELESLNEKPEYENFFVEGNPEDDELKKVIRPRALPLLHSYDKNGKTVFVWTTFSEDQVDLNYKNEKVFLKVLDVLLFYIFKGAKLIRLDAIAFMWKIVGTSCIHLQQTHQIIKAYRKIIELVAPQTVIITETNVPHAENISYFGNGDDEAHMVYNFTLPPLIALSLHQQKIDKLALWANSLALPSNKNCYFNFTASHDGTGVRPLQGIVSDEEINNLAKTTIKHGGFVSYKSNGNNTRSVYELNCNYMDLLTNPKLPDHLRIQRFLLSQSVMITMPGVPAVYYHSIFGSENHIQGVLNSGINRRINREKLDFHKLNKALKNKNSLRSKIYESYVKMLKIRTLEKAFNPFGVAKFYNDNDVFVIERVYKNSTIYCIHNFTDKEKCIKHISENTVDKISQEKNVKHVMPYGYRWLKKK